MSGMNIRHSFIFLVAINTAIGVLMYIIYPYIWNGIIAIGKNAGWQLLVWAIAHIASSGAYGAAWDEAKTCPEKLTMYSLAATAIAMPIWLIANMVIYGLASL